MQFNQAKRFTITNFAKYVAPVIREHFDAEKIFDTESLDDAKFKSLDRQNCIDGFFVTKSGVTQYFASRIQKGFYPTFSVRKSRDSGAPAEFTRLCRLIEDGQLYPRWTVQSYIDDNKITVAIVKTDDLIRFIKATDPPVKHTSSKQAGQSSFYICSWTALKNYGVDVQIFEKLK